MGEDPTTVNQETTTQVVHEVDSSYAQHDIKIPREKKGRIGLIIGIIIGLLVLIGGGIAIWFFAWYNNPEQVAYDAMMHFFQAENVGFEGGLTFFFDDKGQPIGVPDPSDGEYYYSETSPIKSVIISFDNASSTLPNAASAKITFLFNPEVVTGNPRVNIAIQNVFLRNGDLYLQISGLVDSIKTIEVDEDERKAMEIYLNMIELIDNEWWRISIPELLEEMQVPSEQADTLTSAYRCVIDAISQNNSDELAQIYKQHRFVKVTPTKQLGTESEYAELAAGHKAYELSLDKEELAEYLNRVMETERTTEIYGCINQALTAYGSDHQFSVDDVPEISASDIEWSDQNKIYLEISQFGHQLRSATPYFYDDDGNYIGSGTILFKYDPVTVTAPDNYRPITDLFTELADFVGQMIMEQYSYEEEI